MYEHPKPWNGAQACNTCWLCPGGLYIYKYILYYIALMLVIHQLRPLSKIQLPEKIRRTWSHSISLRYHQVTAI